MDKVELAFAFEVAEMGELLFSGYFGHIRHKIGRRRILVNGRLLKKCFICRFVFKDLR